MMTSELYIGALHPSSYDSKEYTVQLELFQVENISYKNNKSFIVLSIYSYFIIVNQ